MDGRASFFSDYYGDLIDTVVIDVCYSWIDFTYASCGAT